LYSGPDPGPVERHVRPERVCSVNPVNNANAVSKMQKVVHSKEDTMASQVKVVSHWAGAVVNWLQKHTFAIVFTMSLLHIGLAYMHVRVPGRVDFSSL
jgi:hypothetical protein